MIPVACGPLQVLAAAVSNQVGTRRDKRLRGPCARQLHQHPAAGRVIDGAVLDRVAIHRCSDPQKIPLRAVDDNFGFQLWIRALNHPGNIARLDLTHFRRQVAADANAERDGPEVAGFRSLEQLIHVMASERQQFLARIPGYFTPLFSRAARNSSPLRQVGSAGRFATSVPIRNPKCAISARPEKSQYS